MAAPLKISIIIDAIDKTAAIGKADERITRFAASARRAALAVGLIGTAIVATLAKGVREFAQFDEAMAEVSTLVDTAAVNMDNLTGAVRQLAIEAGKAPAELALGLYQTISAGVEAGEAMQFLNIATRMAIGGVTDTLTAVDGLTTVINSWGKSAGDATDVADQFFVGMKMGKTTVAELGDSLRYVAGTAANVGIESQELIGAISAITTQGFPATQAARSLNMALMAFLKPSTEAAEKAEELGIALNLQTLESQGLIGAMRMLEEATDGDVEAMTTLIGSSEAARAVFALTGAGLEKFSDIMDEMGNRTGAAAEAFEKMENTITRRMARMRERIRGGFLQIGEAAMPMLEKLIPRVEETIQGITRWAQAHPRLTEVIISTSGAVGGLMLVLAPLLFALPGIVTAAQLFRGTLVALGVSTAAVVAPLGILIGTLALLKLEYELVAGAAERAAEQAMRLTEAQRPEEALTRAEYGEAIKGTAAFREGMKWPATMFGGMIEKEITIEYDRYLNALAVTEDQMEKQRGVLTKSRLEDVKEQRQLAEQQLQILKLQGATEQEMVPVRQELQGLREEEMQLLAGAGSQIEANALKIRELLDAKMEELELSGEIADVEQGRETWLERLLTLYQQITGEQERQTQNLRKITAAEEWMLGLRRGVPTAGAAAVSDLYTAREGAAPWIMRAQEAGGGARRILGELIIRIQKDETAELSPGEKQWIETFTAEMQRRALALPQYGY